MAEGDALDLSGCLVTPAAALASWPDLDVLDAAGQVALLRDASALVGAVCGRALAAADHSEILTPGRTRLLRLREYPLLGVNRVACGLTAALTVSYSGDPWGWQVSVGSDALSLEERTDGGAWASTVLAFADLPTVGALAAAVGAVGSFSARVGSDLSSFPSAYLLADAGARGGGRGAVGLEAFLWPVGYGLGPDGRRSGVLTLDRSFPDGYRFPDRTASGYASDWAAGGVQVQYRAGYEPGAAPPDLGRVVLDVAQYLLDRSDVPVGLQSETLGKYSWKAAGDAWASDTALPGPLTRALDGYRRVEIY